MCSRWAGTTDRRDDYHGIPHFAGHDAVATWSVEISSLIRGHIRKNVEKSILVQYTALREHKSEYCTSKKLPAWHFPAASLSEARFNRAKFARKFARKNAVELVIKKFRANFGVSSE